MKLHLNTDRKILLIKKCLENRITVGEKTYSSSLILNPHRVIENWAPTEVGALTESDFQRTLEFEPELVLLGTGRRLEFPDPAVTRPLIDHGVGLEVMDTAAACRTYNVLAHEGRNVVASLIIATGLNPGDDQRITDSDQIAN